MEVENQQLSEIVVMETKYKTGREGDATIIHTEKFDGERILGEGLVKICERGQIMGIYCQHYKRAWLLWKSQKKTKRRPENTS